MSTFQTDNSRCQTFFSCVLEQSGQSDNSSQQGDTDVKPPPNGEFPRCTYSHSCNVRSLVGGERHTRVQRGLSVRVSVFEQIWGYIYYGKESWWFCCVGAALGLWQRAHKSHWRYWKMGTTWSLPSWALTSSAVPAAVNLGQEKRARRGEWEGKGGTEKKVRHDGVMRREEIGWWTLRERIK